MNTRPLTPPVRYFPVRATYDVAPGLRPLGTDLGGGPADARVFQIDRRFPDFRGSKVAARGEQLGKYHLTELSGEVERAVSQLFLRQLTSDYPQYFRLESGDRAQRLHCSLTGDTLSFLEDGEWLPSETKALEGPPYVSALDALASQIQEDVAVTVLDASGADRVAALHVCNPSSWVPGEKLGLPFVQVHAPVPGMERLAPAAESLVRASVERGPWVRFGWGIAGDSQLNHHPEPPPGTLSETWRRPAFNSEEDPPFYLRVERQVLFGLPEVGASLFVIGTYLVPGDEIRANASERRLLVSALRSMSPASREYKGLTGQADSIISWLET